MKKILLSLLVGGVLLGCILLSIVTNPLISSNTSAKQSYTLTEILQKHVITLVEIAPARNHLSPDALDQAGEYIIEEFEKSGCNITKQSYVANEKTYSNIICTFNPSSKEIYTIGAHYDVHGELPGADDNASGVAGVLEIAKLLGQVDMSTSPYRIDVVAFTLEELPHFRTETMGSNQYVQLLLNEGYSFKKLINLEMIGYFDDTPGSQDYPFSWFTLFYPKAGDFIAVIGRIDDFFLTRSVKKSLASHMKTRSFNAPTRIPGVDFSDQQNFRSRGIPAVMITDTSFQRNKNYHTEFDTPETLNYEKMELVVDGVVAFLRKDLLK